MRIMIVSLMAAFFATTALAQDPGFGIVAVVNDQAISSVDLNDRIALAIGTTNIPDTPETRSRVALQILHQLIDEKLQMEEAARDGIVISEAKLREGIAQIERQNNKQPGTLEKFIESKKLSKLSFYTQIRAQMAWAEIVQKKIRPRIRISDAEVARFVRHKATSTGVLGKPDEVLISIIHLPVDSPKNEANVHKLAEKLSSEIRSGVSFVAVASQFSSGTGSTKASAPFWVEMSQIDPAIAAALLKTPKDGITEPVRTATGYQIVKLVDTRQAKAEVPAADVKAADVKLATPAPAQPAQADLAKLSAAADEAARQAIYAEKIELEAQKFMRDLKREAFIEIKIQ